MDITTLEDYKRELLSEHREEIAAIDRLISRERNKTASSNGAQPTILITARTRRRLSFPSVVTSALKKMTGEFDRDTLLQQIQADYPSFTSSSGKVARELWKRSRNGELKVVSKGAGRIPAIYSRK